MVADSRPPLWRVVLAMAASPGEVLRNHLEPVPWPWAPAVASAAFFLFFLQTGLDLRRAGGMGLAGASLVALKGAALGLALVPALALACWLVLRAFGARGKAGAMVKAFGLGYSPALVYGLCGLFANAALGWNTALAFGITGVLWAIGPQFAVLQAEAREHLVVPALLATGCGALTLLLWARIGVLG